MPREKIYAFINISQYSNTKRSTYQIWNLWKSVPTFQLPLEKHTTRCYNKQENASIVFFPKTIRTLFLPVEGFELGSQEKIMFFSVICFLSTQVCSNKKETKHSKRNWGSLRKKRQEFTGIKRELNTKVCTWLVRRNDLGRRAFLENKTASQLKTLERLQTGFWGRGWRTFLPC